MITLFEASPCFGESGLKLLDYSSDDTMEADTLTWIKVL